MQAVLDEIAGELRGSGVEVVCHAVVSSSPADAIMTVAERSGADLI